MGQFQQPDLYPERKKAPTACSASGTGRGWSSLRGRVQARQHGGTVKIRRRDRHRGRRPQQESSTAAHQSDINIFCPRHAGVLPGSVQGFWTWASRLCHEPLLGAWSGMKTIQEVVESSSSINDRPRAVQIILPRTSDAARRLHIRWPDAPLEQEARLMDYKWYARPGVHPRQQAQLQRHRRQERPLRHHCQRQAYNDTRQALVDLGLTTTPAASWASACKGQRGVRSKPPSPATLRLREILVVEKSARSSNTSSKKSCTTGAPTCAQRAGQVRRARR